MASSRYTLGGVLVKERGMPRYAHLARLGRQAVVVGVGFIVICLVAFDSIANNWAVNQFVGNGFRFLSPIATVSSSAQLSSQYSFAKGLGLTDLSNIGGWMMNFTVAAFVSKNPNMYFVSAGSYTLDNSMSLCAIFQRKYTVDISTSPYVKLGLASDTVSFIRGDTVSHAFTDDASANLGNVSMSSAQLRALGYAPARTIVDTRLTRPFAIANSSAPQSYNVSYYRVFPKSFCTGCDPIAEFGFGTCHLTMVYNDSSKQLTVTSGANIVGSTYDLGLMLPCTPLVVLSQVLKVLAIMFAIAGYLASRSTVQWYEVDLAKPETLVSRLVRTVLPKHFPYASHALRFDMFCYNSDIFVFLYCGMVLLDIQNGLIFLRHMNLYNALAPQFKYSLQLFALSVRLLWGNCAAFKLLKITLHTLARSTYAGENRLMELGNLSGVTTLYLSAILLFYVPPYFEYSNSVIVELKNGVEKLDGLHVDVFNSFYVRNASAIAIGLVANLGLVVLLDHSVHYAFWRKLRAHSFARQAIYNSSSILCDYLDDIQQKPQSGISRMVCKARRLSTLQWFFMTHLTLFGLPEKDLRITKKRVTQAATAMTGSAASSQTTIDTPYLVTQDGSYQLHLVDESLVDVTALVYNIKILKDTSVVIQ
ncbi:hypothetical protein SDRG_15331 [Saprolegnia diclina VS20]|uniref:Uncharacterized protein n=1 Tax=Saprolegnia diclina (strain VS20) TaxID=1156394 RepID=T0Q0C9_SAPDV|nr:hypothetical protein SDRG_15331 [Saprolegnia diclina VS20]EQC26820.1 hypothetical protein SDRG_15331 [Saprolegnia diclina VS20]|eukprot:XP_008619722.1 hypothetical protein SDRG_15331 [Saprolegnia diclina VS20]